MSYDAQRQLAYETLLRHPHLSGADLARKTGIPGRSARRYVGQFEEGTLATSFEVDEVVYEGEFEPSPARKYTGYWKLEGDFLVLNDIHVPATNWEFANVALDIACAHLPRPRKVIIAGDLFNGDALSRWEDIIQVTSLADELTYSEKYLEHLARFFDFIYFSRGNHEDRVLKPVKGGFNASHFRRILTSNTQVKFSMYSYMTVKSGKEHWRITHQKNYSKNPLTVAKKLAAKHHTNVICAHQHHSATGRSECGQYTCIDSGGLHDFTKMSYVQLDDNTSPVMNNGFVLLKNGTGTLITPYSSMTDIGMYGV